MSTHPPRLLLFDPYTGGHHADHLEWLATAWKRWGIPGDLVIAASPSIVDERSTISALAHERGPGRIRLCPLPEAASFERPMSLTETAVRHRTLIDRLVRQENPDRMFAMYLDHAQAAFATRRQRRPRMSGLLFRPEAHLLPSPSIRRRIRRWRKTALLRATMNAPSTEAVFTLDPAAVEAISALSGQASVFAVPDPAPADAPSGTDLDVRRAYSVDPDRSLWVLPGALGTRKGVFVLMDALGRLRASEQKRLCIVLAGDATGGEGPALEASVSTTQANTDVQIVWDRRFLPAGELQAAIAQSDGVLAPYVDHVGSSGIVMRTAVAGRPLIAQSSGLVGAQVREHLLGRGVASGNAEALALALRDALGGDDLGFDRERAQAFARAHTVDAYARAIFHPLGLVPEEVESRRVEA